MKNLLYIILIFLLSGFAKHKYYVSVTEIDIKKDHLEIIMRTFPDDIENVLSDLYHIKADLSQKQTQALLKDYIQSHFKLWSDKEREPIAYQYLGYTIQDGFVILLLKAELLHPYQSIEVKNTVLFDLFDTQKNIIHFINEKDKKSFILVKSDPVAIYHFSS